MVFAMQLPNRILAIIAQEKLTDYLLNTRHRWGGTKARLLEQYGYSVQNWRQLEADIRSGLETEVVGSQQCRVGVSQHGEIEKAAETYESLSSQ